VSLIFNLVNVFSFVQEENRIVLIVEITKK
jgi:hypothetical protein